MQLRRAQGGFTLTELAVVMVIVGFLVAGGIMTFNAQVEQRNYDETLRRLNAAADALLGYAIVNRRLPCPAAPATTGVESPVGGATTCNNPYNGFLPAETIGFPFVDVDRYGVDAYSNRIRYAISSAALTGCTGSSTLPHFSNVANLKANGMSCRPNDLDVCQTATGTIATSCNTAARVVSAQTAAFIVFSTGKNGALPGQYGTDEIENTDGDRVFVSRTPGTTGTAAYDDLMVVVPVGILYSRLMSAGVLP